MSNSNAVEVDILTYYFTAGAPMTRPTAWYLSLHTDDPGDTGANEVTTAAAYTNYARKSVTFAAPTSVDVGPSTTSNTGAVSFPALSGTGATVTHVGIWTALTGGTLLRVGALAVAKTVAAGEVLSFAIGEVILTEE
jgi:hypothetical protein